jgi:hypothetical protein
VKWVRNGQDCVRGTQACFGLQDHGSHAALGLTLALVLSDSAVAQQLRVLKMRLSVAVSDSGLGIMDTLRPTLKTEFPRHVAETPSELCGAGCAAWMRPEEGENIGSGPLGGPINQGLT